MTPGRGGKKKSIAEWNKIDHYYWKSVYEYIYNSTSGPDRRPIHTSLIRQFETFLNKL